MLRASFLAALTLVVALVAAPAAEVVYQPPNPRPANPAAAPGSRADDWLAQVQSKFDKYGNKHADIVFDGDSITNRWENTGHDAWARFSRRAADFGIEGDRTENVLWRLSKGQVDGVDPKVVVLMIGTNNTGRDNATQIAEGVKAIIAEYEKRCPNAHIILMGVFPRGKTADDGGRRKVAAVNDILKTCTEDKRVSYVDISSQLVEPNGEIAAATMPDFVHPTAKGYTVWANAIQALIDRYAPGGN